MLCLDCNTFKPEPCWIDEGGNTSEAVEERTGKRPGHLPTSFASAFHGLQRSLQNTNCHKTIYDRALKSITAAWTAPGASGKPTLYLVLRQVPVKLRRTQHRLCVLKEAN
eukprot:1159566-Pelagomonas_calceolata.AAC.26